MSFFEEERRPRVGRSPDEAEQPPRRGPRRRYATPPAAPTLTIVPESSSPHTPTSGVSRVQLVVTEPPPPPAAEDTAEPAPPLTTAQYIWELRIRRAILMTAPEYGTLTAVPAVSVYSDALASPADREVRRTDYVAEDMVTPTSMLSSTSSSLQGTQDMSIVTSAAIGGDWIHKIFRPVAGATAPSADLADLDRALARREDWSILEERDQPPSEEDYEGDAISSTSSSSAATSTASSPGVVHGPEREQFEDFDEPTTVFSRDPNFLEATRAAIALWNSGDKPMPPSPISPVGVQYREMEVLGRALSAGRQAAGLFFDVRGARRLYREVLAFLQDPAYTIETLPEEFFMACTNFWQTYKHPNRAKYWYPSESRTELLQAAFGDASPLWRLRVAKPLLVSRVLECLLLFMRQDVHAGHDPADRSRATNPATSARVEYRDLWVVRRGIDAPSQAYWLVLKNMGFDLCSREHLAIEARTPFHTLLALAPLRSPAMLPLELDCGFMANRVVEDAFNNPKLPRGTWLLHNCFGLVASSMLNDMVMLQVCNLAAQRAGKRDFVHGIQRVFSKLDQIYPPTYMDTIHAFAPFFLWFCKTIRSPLWLTREHVPGSADAARRFAIFKAVVCRFGDYFSALYLTLMYGDRFQPSGSELRRLADKARPKAAQKIPVSTYVLWNKIHEANYMPTAGRPATTLHGDVGAKMMIFLFVQHCCAYMEPPVVIQPPTALEGYWSPLYRGDKRGALPR